MFTMTPEEIHDAIALVEKTWALGFCWYTDLADREPHCRRVEEQP
jgi:hypothetical protein